MISRGARRALGALISATLLFVTAAAGAGVPDPTPVLEGSSVPNAWIAPTAIVPDEPGGRAYDADDPPYKWTDGRVEYLETRWSEELCDGSLPGDIAPQVTVTERDSPLPGDGLAVKGSVTVSPFGAQGRMFPARIVRFRIEDPAYPHGLAAGRHVDTTNADPSDDVRGGGAPFTASWTVYPRLYNGICDTTHPATDVTVAGVDRFLPRSEFTRPTPQSYPGSLATTCVAVPNRRPACTAGMLPRYAPQHGAVVIEGAATDPATPPTGFGGSMSRLETSGIAAVVVRLFNSKRGVMRFWTFANEDCAATHPLDATISRCSDTLHFSIDITNQLRAGSQYGVDAYAIDLAGYRTSILSSKTGVSNENTNGKPAAAVQFYYLGNF